METVQSFYKNKLKVILQFMQDQQTLNYTPSEIVLLIMFAQRVSVLFPLSNFANYPYDDYKLKFIADLLNWSTFLKPLSIEDNENLYTLIFYFLGLIQWLLVTLFFFISTQLSIISGIYRVFFSILQQILIQPTLMYLSLNIQKSENYLVYLMIIPIIINIITNSLIQRNYCLPIHNPFHKRYSIFNYFNITFDIFFILAIEFAKSELLKDIWCLMWFTGIQIDAFINQPYSYYVNNQYILLASVQIFIVITKLMSYFLNQSQTLIILLMIVSLLTIIQLKIYRKYVDQQIYYGPLNLKKILLISDIILSTKTNKIEVNLILVSIRSQHKLEINEYQLFYQQIHCLLNQLFDLYISNLDIQSRYSNEDLFLYKIVFLIKTYNKAQLGYIFLKSYQANSLKQSYYFRIMSVILEEQIKTITEKKTIMSNLLLEKESKLNLFSIRQAEILYENGIKLVQKIVDSKIKFWVKLQQGYKRIEEFAGSAREISILMWSLKKLIYKQLKINPDNLQRQINHMNVIELKILSILYSVILNDLHSTLDVENRVDELLSMERNISSDEILNTTLIKDELILLSTSIVKNRGQLINQNRAALAQFFGYEDDKEFITIENINSFMPNFIQKHHDEFLNDYIRTGYSSLFDQSREVFYIMKNKHIKCCYLTLVHIYENLDDYIITGALQKVKDHMDFIIFDEYGKIVGITEQAFISLTETDLEKQSIDRFINNAYIYFWFQQIFDVISKEREEIAQNQERMDKTSTFNPLTNMKSVIMYNNQFIQTSFESYLTNDGQANYLETKSKPTTVIPIFIEEYRNKINSFCQKLFENQDQSVFYKFRYNLRFRLLGKQKHPIFIMQIYEIDKYFQKVEQNQQITKLNNQQYDLDALDTIDNKHTVPFELATEKESEFQFNCSSSQISRMICPQNISNTKHFLQEINSIQLGLSHQINSNSVIIPALVLDREEIFQENLPNDLYKSEANLISQRNQKQKLINDYNKQVPDLDENEIRNKKSLIFSRVAQKKTVKQDVVKILQQNKEGIVEQNINFGKSQASSTSENTQTYIYTLLRSLSYTQKYQRTIIKAVINTLLLFLILFALKFTELKISRIMTSVLKEEIPLVRITDRFNRLFCTFVTLGQMDLQFRLLNQTYSPYYQYRMFNESAIRRIEMQELMSNLQSEFSYFESSGKLVQIKIRIINEFYYEETLGSMTYFWQLVNEVTQSINQDISSDNITNIFKEQISVQMLKGNLNSQLMLTQSLVQQIREQFFSNKDKNQFYQMILMTIQILVILSLIVVQFHFWKDPFIYQRDILLLIARVSEKDIENINIKLYYFKELLNQVTNKWKVINYFQEFYQKTKQQNTLKTLTSNLHQHKKNQNKAKLTSRIQETQFSLWQIYLMLFILWAQLSAFCISSYLYQNNNIQNSQPELELCMTFVKFKSDFDGVMILSQLLKNQQILIDETMKSGVFARNPQLNTTDKYFKVLYDEMLTQFVTLYSNSVLGFSQIYSNIVSSQKLSANNKILLLGLYQEDLCKFIGEELPFCNYENGIFKYFPTYPEPFSKNNNRESFKYGLNGLYSQIESIFKSYYNHELKGEKDTFIKEVQSFIDSAEYNQLILGYYFDINKAMVQFYITIIQASIDILEEDYQKQFIYSLVYGIFASVLLFLIIAWRSMSLQREIRAVRQALVLIPHENLLDQQTYNAIKRFERTM